MLADPNPHKLLCIEEPENQLYPHLLGILAEEFREYAFSGGQVFISTHSPEFVACVRTQEILMPKKHPQEITIRSSAAEYLTFVAATGDNPQSIEMRYRDENIWLTQKMLAVLYDVEVNTINEHLKKIYADSELAEEATIRKFLIVQNEGSRRHLRELETAAQTTKGRKAEPPNA
jgi:ABC-type multidrug transport system ATPase subunit